MPDSAISIKVRLYSYSRDYYNIRMPGGFVAHAFAFYPRKDLIGRAKWKETEDRKLQLIVEFE